MMKACTHSRRQPPKDYGSPRLCRAFGLHMNKELPSLGPETAGEANSPVESRCHWHLWVPKDRCGEYWSPYRTTPDHCSSRSWAKNLSGCRKRASALAL